jgi:hypothetical protein
MTTVAVSSFSLRELLGTIRVPYVDADGKDAEFVLPYPRTMSIAEFIAETRDRFGDVEVEICQIQLDDVSGDALTRIRRALDRSGALCRANIRTPALSSGFT